VAEALGEMLAAIGARTSAGKPLADAVIEAVREAVVATKAVRFEGNNYAAEWVSEAAKRGLPNLKATPEALAELVKPDALAFFEKTKVFGKAESEARYHVRLERYVKDVEIELEALRSLVSTHVLPAAYRQQGLLAAAGASHGVRSALERISAAVDELTARMGDLQGKAEQAVGESRLEARASACAQQVLPAMAAVREVCDRVEEMVADGFWTLPKYREMLLLV
jgi:glutamine synthetase